MHKISDQELAALPIRGKGKATTAYNHIFNLHKGENLLIEKTAWKRKDTPGKICRYIEKKHPAVKYHVLTMLDKKGWVVKRVA